MDTRNNTQNTLTRQNLSLAEDYTVSVVPTIVVRILDAIEQLIMVFIFK